MLITPIVVNHFTIYVSQAIMLYTLNLYNDICQLFLNKTGGKIQKEQQKKTLPGQC